MDAIWSELLEFESKDLVSRYMKRRHDKKPNGVQIDQITANFIQGREYFTNASRASITVRPLLQYYGVMSLSKGLILFLVPTLREEHLKSSHGLNIVNWKEVLKNKDFENINISVGTGTFTQLLEATENTNYLRANSNKINYKSILTIPPKDYRIFLKQLIQYFPDLKKQFKSWIDEELEFVPITSSNYRGEKITLKLRLKIHEDLLDKFFPIEYCKNRKFSIVDGVPTVEYEAQQWSPNITQLWDGPFGIGDACIVPVLPEDKGLSILGGMYMISYVFGMMARYYPSSWINIQRGTSGDKLYPFTCQIFDFINVRFPMQVLDFLKAPYDFEKKHL